MSDKDDVYVGLHETREEMIEAMLGKGLIETEEDLKHWDIESIPFNENALIEGYKIYSCIAESPCSEKDVKVTIAQNEEEAKDIFAHMLHYDHPYMSEYVNDIAINGSSSEQFYYDDKEGYMFSFDQENGKLLIRKDIRDKFHNNRRLCWEYIDKQFVRNVDKFFRHNEELKQEYLYKAFEDADHTFDDDMCIYFWRWDLLEGYEIKEVEVPGKEVAA